MGMQALEQRLERMVEGVFRRSRNSIRPIELGRRLIREMDETPGKRALSSDRAMAIKASRCCLNSSEAMMSA